MKEGKGADIKAGSGRGDQNRAGSSNPAPKAAPNHELCPKRNHQLLPKGEQSVSRTAPPSHTGLFAGNVVISPFISQKIALTPSLGAENPRLPLPAPGFIFIQQLKVIPQEKPERGHGKVRPKERISTFYGVICSLNISQI